MNGFKDNEIVVVSGRAHPCIGGRLRIIHELHKDRLSIETELVDYKIDQYAVVRSRVTTSGGVFSATGTATASRDPKLVDSLLELAESRSAARALRLAGVGVETCGFEELGAGPVLDGEAPHQEPRVAGGNGHRTNNGSGGGHHPPLTSSQRRAIVAIGRSAGRDVADLVNAVYPGAGLDDLTLSMASAVIDRARGKSNGNGHGHAGPGVGGEAQ